MYNDILTIGPFTIHGYGLMIAIGVLAALFIGESRARRRGMNSDEIYNLTLCCAVLGFLGAKLLFCIIEWRDFLQNPWSILSSNGFVVYGGIIAGVLAGYGWCRIRKLVFWDYFDIVLPSVAVAQGFGRLGCFLAGCCYGQRTESVFGIAFHNSQFAPNDVKLIPTQLLSAAGMFAIAGILFWYAARNRRGKTLKQGSVGFLYLILYSVGRFGVEFLRDDYRGEIGVLSTSQFISIFILIGGVLGFVWRSRSGAPSPEIAESLSEDEAYQ
ncbi:MAG: prolipoprotein diacylglyceryl transferase [Muribaculum sp.]|nr:prolipoprotein diacylglyceryl transferase [Muribaculum sp.]